MSKVGDKKELQGIHNLSSGENDISLYRRFRDKMLFQRLGYDQSKMAKEAAGFQKGFIS